MTDVDRRDGSLKQHGNGTERHRTAAANDDVSAELVIDTQAINTGREECAGCSRPYRQRLTAIDAIHARSHCRCASSGVPADIRGHASELAIEPLLDLCVRFSRFQCVLRCEAVEEDIGASWVSSAVALLTPHQNEK